MDTNDWIKLILITIGMVVAGLLVVGVGGYVFVRVIASIMNSRRDSWESSAQDLGLTVDRSAGAICKPFSGELHGLKFSVSHFAIMRSKQSADDYAAVEMVLGRQIPFSFEIEKPESFLLDLFDPGHPETGHDIFDRVFTVSSSDMPALNQMLNVEMFGGESPTLLTDLLLAAKRFHRVKITDRSATVGIRCDFGQSDVIDSAINKAAYIASRIEAADRQISQGND